MIASAVFAGKRYAVLGLARSGLATVDALVASGARVVAWDTSEEARKRVLQRRAFPGLTSSGVPHPPTPSPEGEGEILLGDPLEIDLAGFDGVAVSPGVPLNRHPIAGRASAAGVPVIGDIELFAQARSSLPAHRVVGITGTNGKSTTTALVHHICKTAGLPTTMGGNIGLPILAQEPLPEGGVYVLELSSYQIDLTFSLDCDVAVLLNITPDHLDRYDGFAAYAASKARLFAMSSGVAVVTGEDEASRGIAHALNIGVVIPAKAGIHGSGAADVDVPPSMDPGVRRDDEEGVGQTLWPALQGPHNLQNVAAAREVAKALDIADDIVERALQAYPGLPHRMERVAEREGVLFVNDSKATNATATAPALGAYPKIHWILGGRAKTDELDACAPYFGNVVAGYTIGEAGELFAGLLREGGVAVTEAGTLEKAVKLAAAVARAGEVVMLSPACASFDQFRDYEARGDAFRAAVGAL